MLLRSTKWLLRSTATVLLACAPASVAWAQDRWASAFEQDSAPLGEALDRFGRHFDFDVAALDGLVQGRTAGRVEPTANPLQALEQMLHGTGLVLRFTRPDAIVLEPSGVTRANMTLDRLTVVAPASSPGSYSAYGQYLLDRSLGLLRASGELAKRRYELRVYLWVDPDGRLTKLRVRGEDGHDQELTAAEAALSGLTAFEPPPQEMPQPVKLRIASR